MLEFVFSVVGELERFHIVIAFKIVEQLQHVVDFTHPAPVAVAVDVDAIPRTVCEKRNYL